MDACYNGNYEVFNGKRERARLAKQAEETFALLKQRPGLFARSLFANMLWFGPDLALADGQKLILGGLVLTVWKTPGHSQGSLTYSVGEAIFPGDLIVYHETGYLDYPLASREDLAASIRRLYAAFPDGTVIYPGHGERSTIGYEKIHNRNVTAAKVIWPPAAGE